MSTLKLYMNELGLLRTADGKWGIRQMGPSHWAIQHRSNPHDPWDWNILGYRKTKTDAISYLTLATKLQEDLDEQKQEHIQEDDGTSEGKATTSQESE